MTREAGEYSVRGSVYRPEGQAEDIMRLASCALIILAMSVMGFAGGAAAQTAAINISLTSYAFTPGTITLVAATTYRLHLSNDASRAHSFSAPEFFAASQIAPADQGKVEDGKVELDGGEAIDLTVTPTRAGTYSLDCSHFMHSLLGMHGKIVVQ